MSKVKDLSIIRVMNIFSFSFSSLKEVEPPIKPSQRDKKLDLPGNFMEKLILEEVLIGFRVFKQREYKNDKKQGQLQLSENKAAA